MSLNKIVEKEIHDISAEVLEFVKDPVLCDLLALRNINNINAVKEFINCKEVKLKQLNVFNDCNKVLDRIRHAISNHEKILIWGDFDADGVTSSALMYKTMKRLGADFEVFIPNREEHGHGLNASVALKLIAKHKIKLIITVDCGISNAKEINLLKSLGVDTIVTDHHKLDSNAPDAFAILNPQAPNSLNENLSIKDIEDMSRLAGVGVAYKLALALLNIEQDDELLALASVGTVSDVVPLIGENRTIVSKGLEAINNGVHKGISALFKTCAKKDITSTDIAFILTPRINATGRLATADLAYDFLTGENESSLNFLIEKLDNYNKIRQSLCESVFAQADEMAQEQQNNSAIIIFNPQWHIGIIGIVASKIVEKYNKPVFMVSSDSKGVGRCSIRSLGGYNVYEILKQCADLFLGFGGHALAGGFSFDLNLHNFEDVKTALLSVIDEIDAGESKNCVYVDKFLKADDINPKLIDKISILEPFGQDNPRPLFGIKDARLTNAKVIGKNSNHLKFVCNKDNVNFECVKWSTTQLNVAPNSNVDLAFNPVLNSFNGDEKIQLDITHIYCENKITDGQNNTLKLFDHRKKTGILPQIEDYLSNKELDVTVWAKTIKTLQILKNYPEIENRIYNNSGQHKCIMFFNYPSCYDEMKDIISTLRPSKIHLMNDEYENNIESVIKIILGMLKYSHNHKGGQIDILKFSQSSGTTETFVKLALELLCQCNSIAISDTNTITYIEAPNFSTMQTFSTYKKLVDEFQYITDFKKHLAEDSSCKVYELVSNCLK